MELRRLLALIRQRLALVVVIVLAALTAGYFSTSRVAEYSATSTLFVGVPIYSAAGTFSADLQSGQELLATTFATMVPTPNVVQAAIESTRVPRSVGQVIGATKASVVTGTNLLHVSVTDTDPVVAQALANGISNAFVSQIAKIDPVTPNINGTGPTQPPASVSQPAPLPLAPVSTGLSRNLSLAGAFGLVVAIGLVLLLDYLDISVRAPEDLEQKLGLPVLGIIPFTSAIPERERLIPEGASRTAAIVGDEHA